MSKRAQALQQAARQGVFYITGGGSALISELLTTPGASKTVLEARVPYAAPVLTELLGGAPEQASSQSTARALAMAAFTRATALEGRRPFGLACTAALATDRVRRGAHRAHIALQTLEQSQDWRFDLAGTRKQEEAQLLEGLWLALATVASKSAPITHRAGDPASTDHTRAPRSWRDVLAGRLAATPAHRTMSATPPALLLPGSFNPLHDGHRQMLALAEQRLGVRGAFELSIVNVDKPALDYSTIKERTAAFRGRNAAGDLWLTARPTFVEKARAFPDAAFAVGADTITRIGQPRYYDGSAGRDRALAEMESLGTRFVVFGRSSERGFETLDQLRLPAALRALCIGVEESEFRSELSSTAIRAARQPGG